MTGAATWSLASEWNSPGLCLYAKLKADQLLTSAPDMCEQNGPVQTELNILETH